MTVIKFDGWGPSQLEQLHLFFKERAQPGDTVVFDRVLAENNGRAGEALDDNGCNDWVYHVANQALAGSGLSQDIVAKITLKTDYLMHAYPQKITGDHKAGEPSPGSQTATSLWDEEDTELDDDAEAEAWADAVAQYRNRHEPA